MAENEDAAEGGAEPAREAARLITYRPASAPLDLADDGLVDTSAPADVALGEPARHAKERQR